MMKSLLIKYNKWWLLCCFIAMFQVSRAQTEVDAIMVPKQYICPGVMYGYGSWTNYWEGTFKRDNQNLGLVSNQMYSVMVIYGISSKFNLLVNAPYISTNASGGTLAGQHGFQDISTSLKWMPVETVIGSGLFSLYGIGTVSVPLTNYVADFQPMSIGFHNRSAAFRLLVDYQYKDLFFTGSGQYVERSNVTIDRTSYYTTSLIYSNRVSMPNVAVYNFRTGYRTSRFRAEAVLENSTTLGGFDIRKNDMPFPSNKMIMTSAGADFKYSFNSGLEFSAGGSYVLSGRNIGQSSMFHGGVDYLFDISKKKKTTKPDNTTENKK